MWYWFIFKTIPLARAIFARILKTTGRPRRTNAKESELAAATLVNKVSIQKVHDLLGHLNEEATRATAKYLDWNLTHGALKNCEFCAKGKGKKNIAKKSKHVKADVPGK